MEWEFAASGWVSTAAAIASDGTVYVGSTGNQLYAIHTDSGGLAHTPWPKWQKDSRNAGRY
jgi:hypothetical protein